MGKMKRKVVFIVILKLIMTSSGVPVSPGADSQFYMTEIVRVNRQAGYVYSKPSVSFDLPARAPPPTPVSTQAPTVDRPQAQQMYYAYPAPAGGSAPDAGLPAAPAAGSNAQSGSSGTGSTGYNYAPQNTASLEAPTATGTGSAPTNQAASAAGYGYNAPTSSGGAGAAGLSTSQSSSSGFSQSQGQGGSSQSNAGSAGYSYDVPRPNPAPGPVADVSTSAPRYLPPPIGDSNAVVPNTNVGSVPITTASGTLEAENTGPSPLPAPVSDQYLPPLIQSPNQNQGATSPNFSQPTNTGSGTGSVSSVPGPGYIPPPNQPPPNQPPPPQTSPDATPRPFAPPPASSYLPPNINSGSGPVGQGTVSTPASTYLPPI